MNIGLIQMQSIKNRAYNLKCAQELMEKACQAGAKVLVLPENFSYMCADRDKIPLAETLADGESVLFLQQFAKKHHVTIVGGSLPLAETEKDKVSNTCFLISPLGEVLARYDKIHLFDINLDEKNQFLESEAIIPGHKLVTADIEGIRCGFAICYDIRFPELFRSLTLLGAKVIFVPAAFTFVTGQAHWEILLRARAIENQVYMVAVNQWGEHFPGRTSYGSSMVVDPWGTILGRASEKEGILVTELDFQYLEAVRRKLPCLNHIREDITMKTPSQIQGDK